MPNKESKRLFIQHREKTLDIFSNFRKSQSTALSWNVTRFRREIEITRQAHSPEGRRKSRQLGRFLSTRVFGFNSLLSGKNNSLEE